MFSIHLVVGVKLVVLLIVVEVMIDVLNVIVVVVGMSVYSCSARQYLIHNHNAEDKQC